jgi:hypothetical protein
VSGKLLLICNYNVTAPRTIMRFLPTNAPESPSLAGWAATCSHDPDEAAIIEA